MRKALELLEQLPQPQSILETGCMRELPTDEAAKNDGCSTMLWDAYACHHDGRVFSCDIDEAKVQQAAEHVSERVAFLVGDSVRRLWHVPGWYSCCT
jgi:predicted O-methyltransferase YrrM